MEEDHWPVVVLLALNPSRQLISDILREDRQRNPAVTLAPEAITASQQQPWALPSWDRLRLLQFLEEENGPGWNLEEYPELSPATRIALLPTNRSEANRTVSQGLRNVSCCVRPRNTRSCAP